MHPLITAQAAPPQSRSFPTWQQVAHASLGLVHHTLGELTRLCAEDPDWDEDDVDVDSAVELALDQVRRMEVQQPADRFAFELEWIKAAAALRLAQGVFGRPDSRFGLRLGDAVRQLEMLPELIEFVDGSGD